MADPYYADELVTLYLGDCLEELRWLTGDVLITDPPYGLDTHLSTNYKRRGSYHEQPEWDADLDVRDTALALWGHRPYAVFASPTRLDGALPCRELPLIWDKGMGGNQAGDTTWPWMRSYELIYVAGPGWAGSPRRSSILSVPHRSMNARNEGHPTPKPVPLMAELVRKAPPGVVVDPFAGSGATLRAAKDEGRRAIGVEMNEAYCERAARRCAQDNLFGALEAMR